jgi:hypothetical protein
MFFFTGVYETVAQAEQDYDAIKALHGNGDIGSYDAAVVTKGTASRTACRARTPRRWLRCSSPARPRSS